MSIKFGVLNPFNKWKQGDMLCDPTVTIVLDDYDANGETIVVTASLATAAEIDFAIDLLKNDLEFTRKKAKSVLKSQLDKIKKIPQSPN